MKRLLIFSAVTVLLLSACSPTRLTTSWKDPDFNVPAYKNIAVAGLLDGLNKRTMREYMERHMAEDLLNMGRNAKAVTDIYGPQAFKGMKEDEVVQMLRNKGYDAVITLAVIDIQQMEDYVPGRISYRPSAFYYSRFGWYYTYWYDRVYAPGYYVTNTSYIVEANLYDTQSDKLVYSAQSETFNPSTIDNLGHNISIRILKDMKDKGALK